MRLARASKNQFFITMMSFIEEQIVFSMNLSRNLSLVKTLERQRLVQAEHLAVLEAIRRKDSAAAGQAMRSHLEHARDRMFEAQRALDSKCSQLMLEFQSDYAQKDWEAARATLDQVHAYFPTKEQPCPLRAEQAREQTELN